MLSIKNLSFQHNKNQEIYHYDLKVEQQEIVAILGESGSGKSTLLDLIAGFLEPLSGSVVLGKKELTHQNIEERPISILFQNHNLFEHLSVEKNILLGVSKRLKNSQEEKKQVANILEEVGLRNHSHKLAFELSGGQQQRVALARVLLREQPILLLDEPFSGLDRETRLEMLSLVKKITVEKNLYTIMITHEIEDANLIANSIYSIKNSKLQKA
jgi:thiamine transport system ATP-binding protein